MEQLFEKLANADWVTIVTFLGAFYLFNEKINVKLEKLDAKIDKLDEKIDRRCDALESRIIDVDKRLCRLEGAFASKDCCAIKNYDSNKLAE